jgi:hypothetical protein
MPPGQGTPLEKRPTPWATLLLSGSRHIYSVLLSVLLATLNKSALVKVGISRTSYGCACMQGGARNNVLLKDYPTRSEPPKFTAAPGP